MDGARSIAVSPRHTILLASELCVLIDQPPRTDFVVRTLVRREANGLPLMTAEMVIASAATRSVHPAAATYPLHFRKTYFPGRLRGEPEDEYKCHQRAAELTTIPPPIGYDADTFRSCLIPGQPYARLTPFGGEPPENNITKAQKLPLPSSAGLWTFCEGMLSQLQALHDGGLAHGDAELHNCIISPAPLEAVLIDFEGSSTRETMSDEAWSARCTADLVPLLREAIFLQCALGRQTTSSLGRLSWDRLPALFKSPDGFVRAIETQAEI